MMVRIRARIKLYIGKNKRKTPFISGYRPLFDLEEGTKISGMIILLDRDSFDPDDEGVVEIKFLNMDRPVGAQFYFYEGAEPLGEGTVLEFIEKS